MRKSELNTLVAGSKIVDKRNNNIIEVVGLENDKVILSNGKLYAQSTICRWYDLAPVEEVDEPIKPTITEEKSVDDENHEEHTEKANNHVIEGKNTIEQIIQEYKCHTQKMQQYTAVKSDKTKGTLIYIRVAKEGGYHFDISQKTWSKLTKDYASWLIENFGACIKDKTRKLYRISCNNLEIFQVLLLTALS